MAGGAGNGAPRCLEKGAALVEVLPDPLDLSRYVAAVQDPSAGAITTFLGVTRDSFQGKTVVQLQYEAYIPMACKVMQEICEDAGRRWDIKRIALAHKTGDCSVGQTSVIVAVSSAHRAAALEACRWVIDELKARVPIWKKEVYESGEVWKDNAESRTTANAVESAAPV